MEILNKIIELMNITLMEILKEYKGQAKNNEYHFDDVIKMLREDIEKYINLLKKN